MRPPVRTEDLKGKVRSARASLAQKHGSTPAVAFLWQPDKTFWAVTTLDLTLALVVRAHTNIEVLVLSPCCGEVMEEPSYLDREKPTLCSKCRRPMEAGRRGTYAWAQIDECLAAWTDAVPLEPLAASLALSLLRDRMEALLAQAVRTRYFPLEPWTRGHPSHDRHETLEAACRALSGSL